jgi:hypothetical protein
VRERAAPEQWLGALFDDETAALRALYAARLLHGGTVLSELVLVQRELLPRALDGAALPPGRLALLVASNAPEPVASQALAVVSEQWLGGCAPLPAAACRDLYRPDALFEGTASLASATQLAAAWPPNEQLLVGSLAEQTARLRAQTGPYLVCGVSLHGATLRSAEPTPPPAAPPGAPADAQAALWPSLQAAYLAAVDSPEGSHA